MIGIALVTFLAALAQAGDQLDRTKRPAGKPAPEIHLPQIQKSVLNNGLNVWLVENHKLPLAAFSLVVQAGSDHDPAAAPGLASLTGDLLDEGTKSRTTLQISGDLESAGASLSIMTSIDGSFVMLSTLSRNLAKALDIYCDVIANPAFPEKEFERIRKQRLAALVQQKDQPPTIAANAFNVVLYGGGHPYGHNPAGTEASLQGLTPNDLAKFYQTYYRPNNATLIVVGDARMSDIVPLLEKGLAGWKSGDVPPLQIPSAPPIAERKIYLIDKPGAAQSEIRVGYPALARSTPDYFPVMVMNRILGGQFTSRINLNLRERHGYTYGANSTFRFLKNAGPFVAGSAVTTDKTDSSLIELLHEISLMKEKGMSADELAFSKKGAIGGFALAFETPAQIAASLQSIILYGLPEDYFNNYLKNIDAVTLDDVQRVSATYLDASKMSVVVVGDTARIKAGIAAAGIGTIVPCDTDGKPLE